MKDKTVTVLLFFLVFLVAFGAAGIRLSQAPDIFTDEILYTRIGIRVAGEGAMVWDSGEPFLVHPPLFFVTEGIYFWLTGGSSHPIYATGNIFQSVTHARLLNAFFAGLTAGLLFLWGKKLRGLLLGVLLAALFTFDPFGVRINRRAMLETLGMLFVLAGLYVFWTNASRPLPRLSSSLWAGLLLGAALLTKELTFTALLAVLVYSAWEVWHSRKQEGSTANQSQTRLRHGLLVAGIAILTYLIYPAWMLTTGHFARFAAEKLLAVQRLVGLVQLTGWNRPGQSMLEFLINRMIDYGTSYILLALGGFALLWIFLFGRDRAEGRFLVAWGAILYPFYAFVAVFGSGNDQFFYFLLVPAILLVGYAATLAFRPFENRTMVARVSPFMAPVLLLIAFLPINLTNWALTYAIGDDNGYARLVEFTQAELPGPVPINSSGDPIKFRYFFPDRPVGDAATVEEALASGIHYYVLAPKDVIAGYGDITPELAAWIQANGIPLYHYYSNSYGDLYLYQVNFEGGTPPALSAEIDDGRHWRSFRPAQAGFVGSLLLMLVGWYGLVGGGLSWLASRKEAIDEVEPIQEGGDHAVRTNWS